MSHVERTRAWTEDQSGLWFQRSSCTVHPVFSSTAFPRVELPYSPYLALLASGFNFSYKRESKRVVHVDRSFDLPRGPRPAPIVPRSVARVLDYCGIHVAPSSTSLDTGRIVRDRRGIDYSYQHSRIRTYSLSGCLCRGASLLPTVLLGPAASRLLAWCCIDPRTKSRSWNLQRGQQLSPAKHPALSRTPALSLFSKACTLPQSHGSPPARQSWSLEELVKPDIHRSMVTAGSVCHSPPSGEIDVSPLFPNSSRQPRQRQPFIFALHRLLGRAEP